jgi:hypothetical protein
MLFKRTEQTKQGPVYKYCDITSEIRNNLLLENGSLSLDTFLSDGQIWSITGELFEVVHYIRLTSKL